MKIAIIGYGLQGASSYKYWRDGNSITICDQNEIKDPPRDVELLIGEDHLKNLNDFDLIGRSPSVHPRDIISANGEQIKDKITTNTNEFFKVCPSKNKIGVTGTKGKGTTSSLITKMLEAGGKKVHLGGNIGTPPLEMLEAGINESDYVVLELANFQLIDLKYSPHIAVCLMVVPEHQDWHEGMEEYVTAKKQLFIHQTPSDIAIYYSDNEISKDIASSGATPGRRWRFRYIGPGQTRYIHGAGCGCRCRQSRAMRNGDGLDGSIREYLWKPHRRCMSSAHRPGCGRAFARFAPRKCPQSRVAARSFPVSKDAPR